MYTQNNMRLPICLIIFYEYVAFVIIFIKIRIGNSVFKVEGIILPTDLKGDLLK